MWGLIVSLLFLSPILDGFQALDGSGRPLPHAVLTFLRSGTTIPKAVYADQDLEVELSDAAGRVTADAQGRFPLIYLAADPTPRYRVMLHTADGVLRWDVDPYICDCTEPPYLFRSPKHQALDEDGRVLAAAELVLSVTGTETPTHGYADADRTVPLANPLRADAGGFFPPIYLDDDVDYRVRLSDRHGELVLDVDPYICECGFLLLTSQPYPIEVLEELESIGDAIRAMPSFRYPIDIAESFGDIVSGTLETPLITYNGYEPEAIDSAGDLVSGEIALPLITYNGYEPEAIDSAGDLMSGEIADVLIRYDGYEAEAIDSAGDVISGELS